MHMLKLRDISPAMKRYIVIGVAVYLFELATIIVAGMLGASSVVAVAVSFWLGLVVSFLLQKVFTFGDKRMHHKILLPQIMAFSVLVLFNFLFTLELVRMAGDSFPPIVVRTFALGVTTIWNFYIYKTRIFNNAAGDEIKLIN